jgi:hypothetical protein
MIDNFSILLSHGLLLFVLWSLTRADELNVESPPARDPEPEGFGKRRSGRIVSEGDALRQSLRKKSKSPEGEPDA